MVRRHSVVKEIQNRILAGKLPMGARLPSERALATELGVSRTSVQAAIRELESLGTISRLANHRPTVAKASFEPPVQNATKRDQIAVWLLPETQDLGGAMILQGIRSALAPRGLFVIMSSPPSYDEASVRQAEVQFLRSVRENERLAGVITWDTGSPEAVPEYLELVEAGIPLVFVDREPPIEVSADVVAVNHRRAAKLATKHLIGLGHRSIAIVLGHDRASSVADRVAGYESTLHDHGLRGKRSDVLILDTLEMQVEASANALIDQVVSDPHGPTALFAVNDRIAMHLFEAAKRRGVKVPERLSIIGFDWLARWSPSGGDLTTIAQPFEEIGQSAAKRILDRLQRPTAPAQQILFEAQLISRNSTSRPHPSSSDIPVFDPGIPLGETLI